MLSRNENGVDIELTADEAAAVEAEWSASISAKLISRPLLRWQRQLDVTDIDLPRSVEDVYDTGITPSDRTKKLIDDKKALRAERPGS